VTDQQPVTPDVTTSSTVTPVSDLSAVSEGRGMSREFGVYLHLSVVESIPSLHERIIYGKGK
jgi:hypothetical protein